MHIAVRGLAAVVSACVIGLVAVASAGAWSQRYYDDIDLHHCVQPGEAAVSDPNSGLDLNYITNWAHCGPNYSGNPSMGLTYMYSDGTTYTYIWSDQGLYFFSDTRTISYGRAICKHGGNLNGTTAFYCETTNQ